MQNNREDEKASQSKYRQAQADSTHTTVAVMNGSVQNLEEAANIASEFIYSLDNLPNEVNHLLQEIKAKETRAQDLQQEIDKDAAKYIRHSIRASASVPSSPSSRAPSPKSNALPAKIEAAYAEIEQLSAEKIAIAQTLIDLITRTRARLDSDLAKVRTLQGETVDYASALGSSLTAVPSLSLSDKNAATQVTDSLRNALTSTPTLPDLRQTTVPSASPPVAPASAVPALKSMSTVSSSISPEFDQITPERRLATSSVKLTPTKHRSASPTTTAPPASSQRGASRLSRSSITRQDTDLDEGDDDAEGEGDDADDERLYCFCQKHSYGDFHLSCVGMKQPTPEKWYCSVCAPTMGFTKKKAPAPPVRKGRKK
ncbi:hypothetical protein C0995_003779 [Termitomyces sp. Mi166|nr:hypothetical protein C0995_003779 [Termitomyces sp. Mi166\